jgi:hypothetical protein
MSDDAQRQIRKLLRAATELDDWLRQKHPGVWASGRAQRLNATLQVSRLGSLGVSRDDALIKAVERTIDAGDRATITGANPFGIRVMDEDSVQELALCLNQLRDLLADLKERK